ncbi:MAG: hypothetical protein Q7K47_10095 [Fusobacterium sp. JB019]|nr:hypothetical protein [Fusobacterium sp. JB019]
MKHSFNVILAEKYGIEEAILIENIAFWMGYNIDNGKNFKEGRYWVYNSLRSFSKLFPYINPKKIQRSLIKLEELNVIKTGNFNKLSYDRTKWYTIIDKKVMEIYNLIINDDFISKTDLVNACNQNGQSISPKCKMDEAKLSNGLGQDVQTIPIIKTIIKPNIKTTTKEKNSNSSLMSIKEKLKKTHLGLLTSKNIMKIITDKKITLERLTEVIDFSLSHNKSSGFIVSALRDNYVLNSVSKNNNSSKRSKFIDDENIIFRNKINKIKKKKEEEQNIKKAMDDYFNSLPKENKNKIMDEVYSLSKEKYGYLWEIMGKTKVKYDVLKKIIFS